MTDPSAPLDQQRFAVLDIETSGLEPARNRILQIAVVTADARGEVIDEWSTYVQVPRWPFSRLGPRHVHGITRRTLRNAAEPAAALRELVTHLDGKIVTAHNAEFDLGFIGHHAAKLNINLPDSPTVCTLTLSRSLDPAARQSHRLSDLCRRYGVTLERAHDALADARATAGILPHLIQAAGISTTDALLARSAPTAGRRQSPGTPTSADPAHPREPQSPQESADAGADDDS